MSLKNKNTYKARTTNYDTETKSSDVKKKIKNSLEQNFEGKKIGWRRCSTKQLEKKYQNLILGWNILILLFLFIVFNTSEERFDRIWSCDTKPE